MNGGAWSSQVPDRLEFEGRLGVPVGADAAQARAELEAVVAAALDDGEAPGEIAWTGGSFAPAETPPEHAWVGARERRARGRARPRRCRRAGVPWGADMRQFTARGIPCTMAGTAGIELAHAVDEQRRGGRARRARAGDRPRAGAGRHARSARTSSMRATMLLALAAARWPCSPAAADDAPDASAGAAPAVAWVDPDGDPPYIGSLSVNPKDGSLLLGSNTGLFRIAPEGGKPVKVTGELTTPDDSGEVSEALVAKFTGPDELHRVRAPQRRLDAARRRSG